MLCAIFRFGLMDTQVVHKERKRARRVREDEDVQASQPSEYTSKVSWYDLVWAYEHVGLII
jgi:hypothetical protein